MNSPNLEITPQDVTVEGIRIPRPHRISPMQWLDFWEHAEGYDEYELESETYYSEED